MKLSEQIASYYSAQATLILDEYDLEELKQKAINLEKQIEKLKSCTNCTHCYNTEVDVYCNKSKEYIVDFSPCNEWEISDEA